MTYRSKLRLAVLWLFPGLFLLFFFLYPLGAVFVEMSKIFLEKGIQHFELINILRALVFTFWQALFSTLLTLMIGIPASFALTRFTFPGKTMLRILTALPFILPTVVVAAGFNALLGSNGWLNLTFMKLFALESPPFRVLNTIYAILLAHVFYNTTIVIRVVGSALEQMDHRLEDAAQILGAAPLKALIEVTFPLLRLPIFAASLLVFLFDFSSFGVILLLGGPQLATLEVEIYVQALHMLNLPVAGMLSVIQLFFTFLLSLVYFKVSRISVIPIAPRIFGENKRKPDSWQKKLFVGLTITTLIVIIVSPLAALTVRAFTKLEADRGERGAFTTGLTLTYFKEIFINRRGALFYVPPIQAVRNSLIYAISATILSLLVGSLSAYALSNKAKINRWLDPLIMLPLGTSAVTLGLGFIIVFNKTPLGVNTLPYFIPIAHTLVALPFVIRTIQPAILSIPASLRKAAAVQGASPLKIWREIDLPIILRTFLAAGIFAFTISLGEFGATTFLTRPEFPTIPIAIFRFLSQPGALNYGQAMAMAAILMTLCGLSIWVLERLQKPGQKYL